jgi:short-subunit dehydrogenase
MNHAIIVGASSGIGAAIARRLAQQGCRVALVARRGELLDDLARELNQGGTPGGVAFTAVHDVHNRDEVPGLFQELTGRLGGLDLIVYAAGILRPAAPDVFDTARDAELIEVNTLGAMAWLNEAAARFMQTGSGTILGIGSIAGERGRRGNPAYCTSKAALATYLESLRNRFGGSGVRVVTVKPGFVATPMTEGMDGLLWVVSADRAAELALRAARRGESVRYIPGRWRIVSAVLHSIPSFLFRRLNI